MAEEENTSSFQTLTPANLCNPLDIGELSSCSKFYPISSNDEEYIHLQDLSGNGKEIAVNDQTQTHQLHVSDDTGANNFEDMIYVGKVFESDTDAYEQYLLYAMRVGFRVRKNKQYLRDDGSVRSRYFVCFREGERRKDKRCQYVRKESKERRAREETRTGCKARMAVKNVQSKWVVSEIIHEHNHPLTSPANAAFILPDDKDRKIRELSEEIQQEKRLRIACEKRINQVLKDVEEHTQNLSAKIAVIVKSVKILESEELDRKTFRTLMKYSLMPNVVRMEDSCDSSRSSVNIFCCLLVPSQVTSNQNVPSAEESELKSNWTRVHPSISKWFQSCLFVL